MNTMLMALDIVILGFGLYYAALGIDKGNKLELILALILSTIMVIKIIKKLR